MTRLPDPSSRSYRGALPWLRVVSYFLVFFAAMVLGGLLFLLGGITIILIPGSLPLWVEVGYVLLGIGGSVGIAVLAANGAFRWLARESGRGANQTVSRPPTRLAWLAGIAGTIIAAAGSAAVTTIVTRWLGA